MKPHIYNGLMKYSAKRRIQFTSPGHKGKVRMKTDTLCRLDVTSLAETDEMLNPRSFILQSEKHIAGTFGAKRSYYLTGGTSSGIYASLATLCKAGDKVIVDPECDKSVINAITVLALIPVFIKRMYNSKYAISGGINTEELEYLTERHRDAKAIIITSPTYYGVCANIRKAAEIAHGKNMYLIVDEALGMHFTFWDKFPEPALFCGADIVVHNCSKTLGGFSGSGLLHLRTEDIPDSVIREQLAVYQGGSGSTALLCATENAIIYARKNRKKYQTLLKEIERGKHLINRNTDVFWFDVEFNNGSEINVVDKTKIVLNFSKVDICASDAAKILINKYGIEPDSADRDNLIFSVSLYNTPAEVRKLINSCMSIAKLSTARFTIEENDTPSPPRKKVQVMPYKAFYCEGEKVDIEDSAGRLCRSVVYKIPNGSPIIIPGEKITDDHIEKIKTTLKYGGVISGIDEENHIEVLSLGDSFYV